MRLGPRTSRPRDIACIFYGRPLPYLLRLVGRHYIFMGQCYIHGYMFGEAMKEVNVGKREGEWFELC
jgi:hypothetical protein